MIKDLKDLEKLLKLLRKQGVQDFKMGDIALKLGDLPSAVVATEVPEAPDPENPYANFPEGMLTPEQLMFYSSGGNPEDDPENQAVKQ